MSATIVDIAGFMLGAAGVTASRVCPKAGLDVLALLLLSVAALDPAIDEPVEGVESNVAGEVVDVDLDAVAVVVVWVVVNDAGVGVVVDKGSSVSGFATVVLAATVVMLVVEGEAGAEDGSSSRILGDSGRDVVFSVAGIIVDTGILVVSVVDVAAVVAGLVVARLAVDDTGVGVVVDKSSSVSGFATVVVLVVEGEAGPEDGNSLCTVGDSRRDVVFSIAGIIVDAGILVVTVFPGVSVVSVVSGVSGFSGVSGVSFAEVAEVAAATTVVGVWLVVDDAGVGVVVDGGSSVSSFATVVLAAIVVVLVVESETEAEDGSSLCTVGDTGRDVVLSFVAIIVESGNLVVSGVSVAEVAAAATAVVVARLVGDDTDVGVVVDNGSSVSGFATVVLGTTVVVLVVEGKAEAEDSNSLCTVEDCGRDVVLSVVVTIKDKGMLDVTVVDVAS